MAAAGALAFAGAVSAVAVALPAGSSASSAFLTADVSSSATQTASTATQSSASSPQLVEAFLKMRATLGERQYEYNLALMQAAADKQQADAAKAAAQRAAAARAAAQRAAAQQATARQAAVVTPSGSPQQIAQQMLGQFGWSASQFSYLQPLWAKESGWSVTASNPSSGAYGIPQALPGSKMASAGPDWQSNAATQIRWGLQYIKSTYGSPSAAWAHEQADGWY